MRQFEEIQPSPQLLARFAPQSVPHRQLAKHGLEKAAPGHLGWPGVSAQTLRKNLNFLEMELICHRPPASGRPFHFPGGRSDLQRTSFIILLLCNDSSLTQVLSTNRHGGGTCRRNPGDSHRNGTCRPGDCPIGVSERIIASGGISSNIKRGS